MRVTHRPVSVYKQIMTGKCTLQHRLTSEYPYEHSICGRMVIMALKSPAPIPHTSMSPQNEQLPSICCNTISCAYQTLMHRAVYLAQPMKETQHRILLNIGTWSRGSVWFTFPEGNNGKKQSYCSRDDIDPQLQKMRKKCGGSGSGIAQYKYAFISPVCVIHTSMVH